MTMAGTKRYDYLAPQQLHNCPGNPRAPMSQSDIIRHLVGNTIHGPLSAFDVLLRATQLRGQASETQVAICVQAILINYGWTDDMDLDIAQHDIERALGVSMTIRRQR